jgi:hypothetical protein
MFEDLLEAADAERATRVLGRLSERGLRFALTGSLAREARLLQRGEPEPRRKLRDVDLVVDGVHGLPDGLAEGFLINHAHPLAPPGKMLLQLVDPEDRVRVDLFRAYGATLLRAGALERGTGAMAVVAIEDLRARLTAHVLTAMRRAEPIDVKHVAAFRRLLACGEPAVLAEAWDDHRESLADTFAGATRDALHGLAERPDLVVVETYAPRTETCARCRPFSSFRLSPPEAVAAVLGYS